MGEASGVSASNRGAEVAVVNNTEKTLKEKRWSWEGFKAKKAEFMNACKVAAAGCALALGAEAVVGGSALATAGATLPVAAGVSELTVQACTGAAVICGVTGVEGIGQNVFTKEKGESDGSTDATQEQKRVFESNPKHGPVQRGDSNPAPKNPQEILNNSVEISKNTSRRVGVDKKNDEFNIFDETQPGKAIFHGHTRTWGELTEAMKSALIKSGLVNHKGKIL